VGDTNNKLDASAACSGIEQTEMQSFKNKEEEQ
jgi:hypothetical protein